MNQPLLTLSVDAEREAIARGEKNHLHLVAEVIAADAPLDRARAPLSVVFVLDVSSSMAGAKLEHVIRSTERLVELLGPDDRAGIVSFSSDAEVAAQLQRLDSSGRRALKAAARRMSASGSTNIDAGLRTARTLFTERAIHERRVMLLLSDGQPNQDLTTPEGLGELTRGFRPLISVSALGYGADHDERVLSAIAGAGGGSYHYIANPELCQHELAKAIGAQGDVVADMIELAITPRPGVTIERLVSASNVRFGFKGIIVPLADMTAGAQRLVAAEVSIEAGQELMKRPIAEVSVEYRSAADPSSGRARVSASLEIPVAPGWGDICVPAHHRVLVVRADQARQEARAQADRGQYPGAAAILRAMIRAIETAPGYVAADGSALSEACEQLIDDTALFEKGPSAEEYRQFVYGQRASFAEDGARGSARPAQSASSRKLAEATAGNYPEAQLMVIAGAQKGAIIPLGADNTLGRSRCCEVVVQSSAVSRRHSNIFALEGEFFVSCLGSTNGTYVNGKKIDVHKLVSGDVIQLGDTELRYEARDET